MTQDEVAAPSDPAPAARPPRGRRALWALGLTIPGAPLLSSMTVVLLGYSLSWLSVVALWVSVAATIALVIALAIRAMTPPRSIRDIVGVVVVSLAIWATPAVIAVLLRLAIRQCPVLNLLGLPWPAELRIGVIIAGIVIIVIALVGFIVAARSARSRAVARVWAIAGSILGAAGFVLFFLLIYGDPAAGCLPA